MQMPLFRQHALLAAALLAASTSVFAENWPQWRGPTYDGVSSETGLAYQWDAATNIRWAVDMPGPAASTPAIFGDRIFLTVIDGDKLAAMCLDTAGRELWRTPIADAAGGRGRGEGNLASPSPSTDGRHVWCFFGNGELACLDRDGAIVWRTNIQERYGKFRFGFGMHMTPVLFGDRLYLQLIHSGGAWVIALDKATGKEVWKQPRESDGVAECEHSYASPTIWNSGDDAYLITHGNDYTIAHQLGDGAEIWRLGDLNPKERYNRTLRFVASPVATSGLIVSPTAKNGAVVGVAPAARGMIDRDRTEHQVWRRDRGTPDVPSPLVHDGLVYLCRENGNLQCLDAKTGEEYYYEKTHRHKHRASPVYADGRIYLTSANGVVSVVQAGRTFKLLAQNKLDDTTLASPAISGGVIYLRGFNRLYAIAPK